MKLSHTITVCVALSLSFTACQTPLYRAVKSNDVVAAKRELAKGADPDEKASAANWFWKAPLLPIVATLDLAELAVIYGTGGLGGIPLCIIYAPFCNNVAETVVDFSLTEGVYNFGDTTPAQAVSYKNSPELAYAIALSPRLNDIRLVEKQAMQYALDRNYIAGALRLLDKGAMRSLPDFRAAVQGDAAAQTRLALCYFEGKGVSKDYKEAIKWFRKAAELGNADAAHHLGLCYSGGYGVDTDYDQALRWHLIAAQRGKRYKHEDKIEISPKLMMLTLNGDAGCQLIVGQIYRHGFCCFPKNEAAAMWWFRKAAEQGHASSQYELAFGYWETENYTEAAKWVRKAAEQGDAEAQGLLGTMYSSGEGVVRDYTEAVKWVRKGAEQGDAKAQAMLGYMYYEGKGVVRDEEQARYWLRKAAAQGLPAARAILQKNGWL